jgi:hypothetical protein
MIVFRGAARSSGRLTAYGASNRPLDSAAMASAVDPDRFARVSDRRSTHPYKLAVRRRNDSA